MSESTNTSPSQETEELILDGEPIEREFISLIRFMRKHRSGTFAHFEFAQGKPRAARQVTLGAIDRVSFGPEGIDSPAVLKGM